MRRPLPSGKVFSDFGNLPQQWMMGSHQGTPAGEKFDVPLTDASVGTRRSASGALRNNRSSVASGPNILVLRYGTFLERSPACARARVSRELRRGLVAEDSSDPTSALRGPGDARPGSPVARTRSAQDSMRCPASCTRIRSRSASGIGTLFTSSSTYTQVDVPVTINASPDVMRATMSKLERPRRTVATATLSSIPARPGA